MRLSRNREASFDVEVALVFRPNPAAQHPGRTDWWSWHEDIKVFSSGEFDDLVRKTPDLHGRVSRGQRIRVGLVRKTASGTDMPYYHAYSCSKTLSGEVQPSLEGTVPVLGKQSVAVFVDGQNFLFALRQLGIIEDSQIVAVLENLLVSYQVEAVKFYICREVDYPRLDHLVSILQGSIEGIEIIDRPMKVVGGNGPSFGCKAKSDVDCWLIADLVAFFYEKPGLGGAVVVAGDSDFLPGLDRCWLSQDRGGPKFVEVVSSQGTVAREFRDHPGITLRFLENLV